MFLDYGYVLNNVIRYSITLIVILPAPPTKIKPKPASLPPQLLGMAVKTLAHGSNQLLLPFNELLLRSNEGQIGFNLSQTELDL